MGELEEGVHAPGELQDGFPFLLLLLEVMFLLHETLSIRGFPTSLPGRHLPSAICCLLLAAICFAASLSCPLLTSSFLSFLSSWISDLGSPLRVLLS